MSESYEVGHKKPPQNRQFGQPDGNAPGKTKVQKRAEMVNAEKAVKLRGKMLDALLEEHDGAENQELIALIDANILKMLKDSEDRGLGAPVQDVRSGDKSMTPSAVVRVVVDPAKEEE